MKTIITLLLSCALIKSFGQYQDPPVAMWVYNGSEILRYLYMGGDEFNGTQLDNDKWLDHLPWGSQSPLAYYKSGTNNIEVNNGHLKITAKAEPGNYGADYWPYTVSYYPYTTGLIYSKHPFKHGLFEINCRMPSGGASNGKGLWPAFWLYGPAGEEIDVFEFCGERPYEFHVDLHCSDSNDPFGCEPNINSPGFGGWVLTTQDLTSNWFTYRADWGNDAIFFSAGNSEFAWWPVTMLYQQNVIINLAVDNGTSFCSGADASTTFPAVLDVNFVRYWKRVNCESTISICNYDQTQQQSNVYTGSTISYGGTNCSGNLNNGEYLDLIALNSVSLFPDFNIEYGANFYAKIVNGCPGPVEEFNPEEEEPYILLESDSSIYTPDSTENQNRLGNSHYKENTLYSRIFPNPANQTVTIEFEGDYQGKIIIELLDLDGRLVQNFTQNDTKNIIIDVSKLKKGMYILRGTFGEDSITDKVIIY